MLRLKQQHLIKTITNIHIWLKLRFAGSYVKKMKQSNESATTTIIIIITLLSLLSLLVDCFVSPGNPFMLFVNNQWLLNFCYNALLLSFYVCFICCITNHHYSADYNCYHQQLWGMMLVYVFCLSSFSRVGFLHLLRWYVVSRFFCVPWIGMVRKVIITFPLPFHFVCCCFVGCPSMLSYVLVLGSKGNWMFEVIWFCHLRDLFSSSFCRSFISLDCPFISFPRSCFKSSSCFCSFPHIMSCVGSISLIPDVHSSTWCLLSCCCLLSHPCIPRVFMNVLLGLAHACCYVVMDDEKG